jgi:hypothetical protein
MSYARQLLDTYPGKPSAGAGLLTATIDALSDCAQACVADADLHEQAPSRPDIPILVLGHGGQARPMTRPWKEGEAIRGRSAGERRRLARNEKPTRGRRDP